MKIWHIHRKCNVYMGVWQDILILIPLSNITFLYFYINIYIYLNIRSLLIIIYFIYLLTLLAFLPLLLFVKSASIWITLDYYWSDRSILDIQRVAISAFSIDASANFILETERSIFFYKIVTRYYFWVIRHSKCLTLCKINFREMNE